MAAANQAIADFIKAEEGFRAKAYYDINAYRAGYGSDTVTLPDGTVKRVTKSTVVTKEDADRDLLRRVAEFSAIAAKGVGRAVWNVLTLPARIALTSIAYNYGRIP